jgi:hypothetical protein
MRLRPVTGPDRVGRSPDANTTKTKPVRTAGRRDHHEDAHPSEEDGGEHCVRSVEAVQRRHEPEQPGHGELRLTRELTQLDDEREKKGFADPKVYFGH